MTASASAPRAQARCVEPGQLVNEWLKKDIELIEALRGSH